MERSEIIKQIEDYAKQTGLKPSTICQNAIRNRNFYDRLKRRKDEDARLGEKVADWISKQSVSTKGAA